ncbi:hypothetical protein HAX54_031387, partial [Datura stramonium]|nr:hypothetical protein [Datura stramonium]
GHRPGALGFVLHCQPDDSLYQPDASCPWPGAMGGMQCALATTLICGYRGSGALGTSLVLEAFPTGVQ